MREEQHKALVSLIYPSLVSLVLWVNRFWDCTLWAMAYTQRSGRWSWAAPSCCQLAAPHPPADALYSLVEAKAAGKLIFVSCLEIFFFFFQHKIIPGWHKGSVAECTQALLGAILLAGPGHAGRDEGECKAVVLRVQAAGIALCSQSNLVGY